METVAEQLERPRAHRSSPPTPTTACGCRGTSCPARRLGCWSGPTGSGPASTLDKRTVEQHADGSAAVGERPAQGPRDARPPPSAASAGSSTSPTWSSPRRPRCRRRPVHDFDKRGGLSTDRAMIRACPVTWPWNLLGWPSINVPAGFTSDGLPIGVQLMGPADSEPLLISLAAELEAVNGWVTRQPDRGGPSRSRNEAEFPLRGRARRSASLRTRNVARVTLRVRLRREVPLGGHMASSRGLRRQTDEQHDGSTTAYVRLQRLTRSSDQAAGAVTDAVPIRRVHSTACLAASVRNARNGDAVRDNRALDGDIGSDGMRTAARTRTRNAGFTGRSRARQWRSTRR